MTRRNNPDRLGPPQPDAPATTEVLQEEQLVDPLSFVVPTEFVSLPSRGFYYQEGHPLHKEESVEIKYMTAKEEDLLSSRSLIEKGIVLDRLIQNLLVDNRIKSRDLLVCDRNAILIAARASGYGPDYNTKIICKECTEADTYSYNLQSAIVKEPLDSEELAKHDVEHIGDDMFRFVIPNTTVALIIRLLNGHDERMIADFAEKRRKKKLNDRLITDQLKLMIVSVMEHTESEVVDRYVNSLPLRDSRLLRNIYEIVSPSIELRKDVVCSSCGYEDNIIFPFTANFFWPDARV